MAKLVGSVEGRWGEWKSGAEKEDFDALMAVSDNLPENEWVGFVASFQVVDGYAYYRVAQARPLALEHIPVYDAYMIPPAHLRGLTLRDLESLRGWSKMFQVRGVLTT